ncbi:hypothetical protein AVEN_275052-1, partial [Araneus ventricosus]
MRNQELAYRTKECWRESTGNGRKMALLIVFGSSCVNSCLSKKVLKGNKGIHESIYTPRTCSFAIWQGLEQIFLKARITAEESEGPQRGGHECGLPGRWDLGPGTERHEPQINRRK